MSRVPQVKMPYIRLKYSIKVKSWMSRPARSIWLSEEVKQNSKARVDQPLATFSFQRPRSQSRRIFHGRC